MDKQKKINDEINKYEAAKKPLLKQSQLYSWLRIFSIFASLALAIYADQSKRSFGFCLAFLFLVLFLICDSHRSGCLPCRKSCMRTGRKSGTRRSRLFSPYFLM